MNSCSFFLEAKAFSKRGLLLTLLHSERPKLHAILVFLSAIGLKERICCDRCICLSLSVDSS